MKAFVTVCDSYVSLSSEAELLAMKMFLQYSTNIRKMERLSSGILIYGAIRYSFETKRISGEGRVRKLKKVMMKFSFASEKERKK